MGEERKVHVFRSESNLIEQEFDSIREKFELEMRKMEEEMSRFRSQLISAESQSQQTDTSAQEEVASSSEGAHSVDSSAHRDELKSTSSTRRSTTTTRTTRRTVQSSSLQSSTEPTWLQRNECLASSPLVKLSADGTKLLKLRFDVSQYTPEQIVVKTVDNRLLVQAKQEEQGNNVSMYREYNREFLLPDGVEPDSIRSSLSVDGVLTVEAPLAGSQLSPIGDSHKDNLFQ